MVEPDLGGKGLKTVQAVAVITFSTLSPVIVDDGARGRDAKAWGEEFWLRDF